MKIIETPIFSKRVREILDDEEYRALQNALVLNPESGKIMQGSGGIRKLRWSGSGRGKRGGSRVIYYWFKEQDNVLMLLIYTKKEKDDLTKAQLRVLQSIVESELQ